MKKIIYTIIWLSTYINTTFADWGFLGNFRDNNPKSTEKAIREWDIHVDDIPNIITWAINILLWLAWTISIIFIIIWAYKILFWSAISSDRTEWKNTIIMALVWFAIASLSWFIIKLIIDNFN